MQQLYYEVRNLPAQPQSPVAADISRHLQMRQYLGTAIIICDNPVATLSAVRKQWIKATRALQRQRASTLNSEEILRITHAIMHMQNMQFSTKAPSDAPEASAYFISPDQVAVIPRRCFTVYVTLSVDISLYTTLCQKLPQSALITFYNHDTPWTELGLKPKEILEHRALTEWQVVCTFLESLTIDPQKLIVGGNLQFDVMDVALDILLDISDEFLNRTAHFQHIINLSQPLTSLSGDQQKIFAAVLRLAHRVQTLTPGSFNTYLTNNFGDVGTEMYFLRDVGSELYDDLEQAATLIAA